MCIGRSLCPQAVPVPEFLFVSRGLSWPRVTGEDNETFLLCGWRTGPCGPCIPVRGPWEKEAWPGSPRRELEARPLPGLGCPGAPRSWYLHPGNPGPWAAGRQGSCFLASQHRSTLGRGVPLAWASCQRSGPARSQRCPACGPAVSPPPPGTDLLGLGARGLGGGRGPHLQLPWGLGVGVGELRSARGPLSPGWAALAGRAGPRVGVGWVLPRAGAAHVGFLASQKGPRLQTVGSGAREGGGMSRFGQRTCLCGTGWWSWP